MKGCHSFLQIFLLLCSAVNIDCHVDEDKIELNDELYSGNEVAELYELCQDVQLGAAAGDDEEENDGSDDEYSICIPDGCIPNCNKHRLERLRNTQNRTAALIDHLNDFHNIFWHMLVFLIVLIQGVYLIFKKHFKWRTLPVIGSQFEEDPTDGYRYSHFMWMQWVTLDSDNPIYYRGMTSETKEIEYLPQIKEWEDPEADSEEELHPSWSIRDIYDMTADPHERLEFYFRRIQHTQQVNKQTRKNIKKFKTRQR